MKKTLLLALSAIFINTVAEAQTIPGNLSAANPLFDRFNTGAPPTTTAGSSSYYYSVITVNVSTAGTYTFTGSSGYDNYGGLYNTSGFDPANPLLNAIEAVDDAIGLNFEITQTLAVGTYTLVFTTFTAGATGPFSVTTTGPASVVLPLDLLSFKGKSYVGYNDINWQTGSEKNTASFELQRSHNGSEYASTATIAAIGEGNHNYSQKDYIETAGNLFYRLKMIDRDGKFSYSNTLNIAGKQKITNQTSLNPNPAQTNLSLTLSDMNLMNSMASIVNSLGKTIFTFSINQSKTDLNVAEYPAGIYFITFNDGSSISFTKKD